MKKFIGYIVLYIPILSFCYLLACIFFRGAPFDEYEIKVSFIAKLDDKKSMLGDSKDIYRSDNKKYKYIVIDSDWLSCCGFKPDDIKLDTPYKMIVSVDGAHTWKDFWTFGEYDYTVETFIEE